MDFHQLLAKMQELDQPTAEAMPVEPTEVETSEGGCGVDMPGAITASEPKGDEPPPSMSLNLNAQGMDNIEQLMKLVTKVNPDMDKPAMPTMGMEPSIASIKPSLPPLKMLPDLDGDDGVSKSQGDLDNDGDHDMDDHDLEKKKDKEEAFANSVNDSEPEVGDMDDLIRDGDDLHKKKSMHKAAAGGDNAMAAESTDLRSQIRAELLRRLEEAKGAK